MLSTRRTKARDPRRMFRRRTVVAKRSLATTAPGLSNGPLLSQPVRFRPERASSDLRRHLLVLQRRRPTISEGVTADATVATIPPSGALSLGSHRLHRRARPG